MNTKTLGLKKQTHVPDLLPVIVPLRMLVPSGLRVPLPGPSKAPQSLELAAQLLGRLAASRAARDQTAPLPDSSRAESHG